MGGRVLLVGGGLTSASIAFLLRNSKLQLTCWEKAPKLGGRMTTHWRPEGSGNSPRAQVDLGPQYITFKDMEKWRETDLGDCLLGSGILKLSNGTSTAQSPPGQDQDSDSDDFTSYVLDDVQFGIPNSEATTKSTDLSEQRELYLSKPVNYVAVGGSQSVVDLLWNKADRCPTFTDHFLSKLTACDDQSWLAESANADKREKVDAVVFTMPVPQFLGASTPQGLLEGDYLRRVQPDTHQNLQSVGYNSVFGIGLFFDDPAASLGVNWRSRIYPTSEVVRYVGVDTLRRGQADSPASISVQSHRTWAQKNLHLTKEEAKPFLLEEIKRLIPTLPEPSAVIAHKWRYSQVQQPYPDQCGAAVLCQAPLLLAGGDGFTYSSVEGCLLSAIAVTEKLQQLL